MMKILNVVLASAQIDVVRLFIYPVFLLTLIVALKGDSRSKFWDGVCVVLFVYILIAMLALVTWV